MRYRITPFNIGALLFAGLLIRYFNLLNKQQSFDTIGFDATFGLVALIALSTLLFIADLNIQNSRNTRGFKMILIVESYGVVLLLLLLWVSGFFKFIFPIQ